MSDLTHGVSDVSSLALEATLDLIYDLLNNYSINVQEKSDDANITYVGIAPAGTATSAASWQIKRIDETTGTIVLFADGNTNFDNVFNNRESLSYS